MEGDSSSDENSGSLFNFVSNNMDPYAHLPKKSKHQHGSFAMKLSGQSFKDPKKPASAKLKKKGVLLKKSFDKRPPLKKKPKVTHDERDCCNFNSQTMLGFVVSQKAPHDAWGATVRLPRRRLRQEVP